MKYIFYVILLKKNKQTNLRIHFSFLHIYEQAGATNWSHTNLSCPMLFGMREWPFGFDLDGLKKKKIRANKKECKGREDQNVGWGNLCEHAK